MGNPEDFLVCAILIAAILIAGADANGQPTGADQRRLTIESGSGSVITLSTAATNVFAADPKVGEVRPASPTSLFVFGVGCTTVAAMDSVGRLISQYEVTVHQSQFGAMEVEAAIPRLMPSARVKAQAQAKGVLLSGQINSPGEAAQAVAIARGYLTKNQAVDNQMTVQSTVQVTLRVRIAEISRQVVRNLGVNWQALGSIGMIGRFPALSLAVNGAAAAACTLAGSCAGANFNAVIDALAQDNLAHILAEPNLTILSSQTASFLVGGEFPIPIGQQQGQVTIEFKKFGVNLAFLPTVFNDGRINIHVSPEVSQLTDQGAVQLTAGNSSIQIPPLTVRRAETTVELGSGQSFVIAGLLQDVGTEGVSGLPFIKDIPVLGALFRSSSFQRNETELVILITQILVKPVKDIAALCSPLDGYTPPSDLERILFARQVGRSTGLPAFFLLAGCQETEPYSRANLWQPTGANRGNIAAMAMRPTHLIHGHGTTGSNVPQGADAVDRVWQGRNRALPAASSPTSQSTASAPTSGASN